MYGKLLSLNIIEKDFFCEKKKIIVRFWLYSKANPFESTSKKMLLFSLSELTING